MTTTIDHAERQKSLHSTDVAAILGLSDRKSEHTVWLEKTGRLEPSKGNDATDAGQYLEPSILDLAEDELGPLERNVVCTASGLGFPLASTLDSRVIATGVPCEAKTSGIVGPIYGDWGDEGTDLLPQVYLVQCTVQMICAGAELAHLYALLGGRGFVRYRVARDEEVAAAIMERCSRWWDLHIEKGIEPEITEPVPLDVLKRIRRRPESEIELHEDGAQAVAEWEAAKATKSASEKTLEAAQSKLIHLLGDAEAGRLQDGRRVEYMLQKRRSYAVKETEYRVLRIKKA